MGFSSSGTSEVTPVFKWFATMNQSYIAMVGTWTIAMSTGAHTGSNLTAGTHNINDEVGFGSFLIKEAGNYTFCLLYTSPSPRDRS